jgi:predicted ATPase/DNA-binding winged helix-turn-helix (wHTH) protein
MHDVVAFGPFRLHVAERRLKRGDETLPLGDRSLDTLIALVDRAGEIVAQRELISLVWPNVTVEDTNLRTHISNLRKVLGDGSEGVRYIVNVVGRGYRFAAPVTRSTPHPTPQEEPAAADPGIRLPPRLNRMIGRDETIRTLSSQLMTSRFVSIVGAGGIGKTTVAISVAHALLADFDGEVFFVDLAALIEPKLVPAMVASALGLMLQTEDPLRSLTAFIGDRKILLILDNCEHVIDVAAMLAERLIGEAPQSHILTTSREALRVEGEHVHVLYALDCPPDDADLTAAAVLPYPAVQLFMERAAASGHGTTLTDPDAPVVAAICRRLDGIALAIELAASRAGSLGIRGIADHLDNRFNLVWQGRRTALPRHQTLSAMLDWSYNLLSPHERAVLGRLCIFVGGFTLEAARSVLCDAETDEARTLDDAAVMDAIASLLAKSLISKTESHGLIFYRLLETTRAFAQSKLAEQGDTNRIARRHASFFSAFLQSERFVQLSVSESDPSRYNVLVGNVRSALQWAFSDEGDMGVELAVSAAPLFIGLSLLEECVRWCERAIADLGPATRGTRQEMVLQGALAQSLMHSTGDSDHARAAIERGLALEEAFEDSQYRQHLLYLMFRMHIRLGNFRGALAAAQQSATFALDSADPTSLLIADSKLCVCHNFIGDQAAAQFYGERAMARVAESGRLTDNFFGLFGFDYRVYAPVMLARALWLRGFTEQACRLAKTAIDDALSRGNPVSICVSLSNASPVFLWSGDFQNAENYAERLVAYAGSRSLELYRAAGVGLKGAVAIARGELQAGIDLLQDAVETLTAAKMYVWLTEFMGLLADGLCKNGQLEEALVTINRGIERAKDRGSSFDTGELLRVKATVLAAMPQHGRIAAIPCLTEALAIAKAQSALALELRSMTDLARLLSEDGQRYQVRRDLALVYGRFTEGFETVDLTIARQVMEQLE